MTLTIDSMTLACLFGISEGVTGSRYFSTLYFPYIN